MHGRINGASGRRRWWWHTDGRRSEATFRRISAYCCKRARLRVACVTHVGEYEGRFGNNFISRRNLCARERRLSKRALSGTNCAGRLKMTGRHLLCKQSRNDFSHFSVSAYKRADDVRKMMSNDCSRKRDILRVLPRKIENNTSNNCTITNIIIDEKNINFLFIHRKN